MLHSVVSGLDLHCFLMFLLRDARYKWVNKATELYKESELVMEHGVSTCKM